jgi:hypothetical protein
MGGFGMSISSQQEYEVPSGLPDIISLGSGANRPSERPNGWTDEDEQNCINEAGTILAELYASGEWLLVAPTG